MILTETGGGDSCHSVAGKSAEMGCLQYQEPTFHLHSKIILGYIPPRTEVNELYVATKMVDRWLNRGYTAYQIALIWNHGQPYEVEGINEYGQYYNSGEHARRVLSNLTY